MKVFKTVALSILAVTSLSATAQSNYTHDRVYAANQVSNTVSVVDPATNTFLGEISLGKTYPGVLNPLYKGAALVHGLRYLPSRKLLAVVSIGSNSPYTYFNRNQQGNQDYLCWAFSARTNVYT